MHNEVEVLSQTCHAATRAYAAATGNPGIPEWGAVSESQRNETRNRVTAELQRLRTTGAGGAGGPTGGGGNIGGGEGDEEETVNNGILSGIVRGVFLANPEIRQRAAA